MDDKVQAESRLRDKLNKFLKKPGPLRVAAETLKEWDSRGWGPILFGGVVRDFVVLGRRRYPRDVDVVLQKGAIEDITSGLVPTAYHVNRFGGLHLNIDRWIFDVWLLRKTWAFTADPAISPSVCELPKTTFLNAEAIAVTIENGKIAEIHSHGFFECVASRRIDINYEPNPFPALNAVRAILTANKLGFQLSPRVASYYLDTLASCGLRSLIDAQEKHYQRVFLDANALTALEAYFNNVMSNKEAHYSIPLPGYMQPKQLDLWPETQHIIAGNE